MNPKIHGSTVKLNYPHTYLRLRFAFVGDATAGMRHDPYVESAVLAGDARLVGGCIQVDSS